MDCCHVVEDAIAIVKAADDESVDKAASMFLSRERDAPSVTIATDSNIIQSVV